MASGPRKTTSRRNRKFGPSTGVYQATVVTSGSASAERSDRAGRDTSNRHSDDSSVSDEITELQRCGVLPQDFPSRDGDIESAGGREADEEDDAAEELAELLRINAISDDDVRALQSSKTGNESKGEKQMPVYEGNSLDVPEFDEDGLPVNWVRSQDGHNVFKLYRLRRGDQEYDNIEREFTDAHIKVKTIERLQNWRLLERFKGEAEDIRRHRTEDFSLNVNYLYHGSNVAKETLCEEGLDQRLSRMGYFGRGIYFSDNPLKCVHYSEDCKQEGPYEAYILKCRVILGDTKVYPSGSSDIDLRREPMKEIQSHGSKYYDSVLGCPKDFNEFVVYENRRAIIEYIITFKADDSVIKKLRNVAKTKQTVKPRSSSQIEGAESRDTTVIDRPDLEQQTDERPEDHFSRITDVRESVRRKRLGHGYVAPSDDQQNRDLKMWQRIRTMQRVDNEKAFNRDTDEGPAIPSVMNEDALLSELEGLVIPQDMSTNEWNRQMQSDYELEPEIRQTWSDYEFEPEILQTQSSSLYQSQRGLSPVLMWGDDDVPQAEKEPDWLASSRVQRSGYSDNMYVNQALSVCVAEFISVTGLEDSSLAKHYVQKAEMDVNHAISMYYEECG